MGLKHEVHVRHANTVPKYKILNPIKFLRSFFIFILNLIISLPKTD
jgi:hypothetical protein